MRAEAWALLRSLSHTARAAALSALSARAQARAYAPAEAAAEEAAAAAAEAAEREAPPRSVSGGARTVATAAASAAAAGAAVAAGAYAGAGSVVRLEDGFVLLSSLGALLPPPDADRERDYLARRLDAAGIARRLDEIAKRVRAVLSADGVAVAAVPPSVRTMLLAVNQVLFVEEGFRLAESYADPRQSLLADVLASRRGLPILLCAVYEAVCRRVGVPGIEPVNMPSFFILKYEPKVCGRCEGADGAALGAAFESLSLRRGPGSSSANAPVHLGPEPRAPEVDAAKALLFRDDEEAFIFVGFGGVFAARADVERFVNERMGFGGPMAALVAVERDASRVWLRALANIARGTAPALLRRMAPLAEIESLMAFAQAPFSEELFWAEHGRTGGLGTGTTDGGSGAARPRSLGLQGAELGGGGGGGGGRALEQRHLLRAHAAFDAADEPRLARLHASASLAACGDSPGRGVRRQRLDPELAQLRASFEAACFPAPERLRCERALAALWLLQLPLPDDASGGAHASPRARLDLRRHALFSRVLALLRGEAEHAALWRDLLA
jgi:hypothetical protein